MAMTDCVHCDGAIPPGRNHFLLMFTVCFKHFPTEYNVCKQCLSIVASFAESPGRLENTYIIWEDQSNGEWASSIAFTSRINPNVALRTIRQWRLFIIIFQWNSTSILQWREQFESWPLVDGFTLHVKVLYGSWRIFHQYSASSRLGFRFSLVILLLSKSNLAAIFPTIPYVFTSMTLLNDSSTQGSITTRIGSRAMISTRCSQGGVVLISKLLQGTEFSHCNGKHSHFTPLMPGLLFCTKFTHFSRIFPHKMDSSNPGTIFSLLEHIYHRCRKWGEDLAKTCFICHQHSWYIRIQNPSPHYKP
jgi:hypothetical protein